jgi:hypothetical protein
MANGYLLMAPKPQFFDSAGNPLAGGKLFAYEAGTTTPRDTFSNIGMTTPNENPVILDAAGRPNSGAVYLTPEVAYKFVLKDASDVQQWTQDHFMVPAVP